MVLNYIWIAFFIIAFVIALVKLVFLGDFEVFPAMMDSTFSSSKTAFEISLGLTGVLSLWLGIMKIGEKGGVVNVLARLLSPVFVKLFPDIPKGHPVTGSIFMNIAANMLGLDNAATPLGLKAMEQLQNLNTKKDTASNPMIMFLVLNTSGLTLIPISILVYRAQLGASQPTDIFIPILLATFFSTLAGVIITSLFQKINLLNRTMLVERDLEAAERIRKVLPDCFSEVECNTSNNLTGSFTFTCKIPNENVLHKSIEAYVHVNRYGVGTYFRDIESAEEFFKQFMPNNTAEQKSKE